MIFWRINICWKRKKALESGEPKTARRAFVKKSKPWIPNPRWSSTFFSANCLVEHGTTVDDVRQGQASLKQFVVNIEKSSEFYRPTLELLSVAGGSKSKKPSGSKRKKQHDKQQRRNAQPGSRT